MHIFPLCCPVLRAIKYLLWVPHIALQSIKNLLFLSVPKDYLALSLAIISLSLKIGFSVIHHNLILCVSLLLNKFSLLCSCEINFLCPFTSWAVRSSCLRLSLWKDICISWYQCLLFYHPVNKVFQWARPVLPGSDGQSQLYMKPRQCFEK